ASGQPQPPAARLAPAAAGDHSAQISPDALQAPARMAAPSRASLPSQGAAASEELRNFRLAAAIRHATGNAGNEMAMRPVKVEEPDEDEYGVHEPAVHVPAPAACGQATTAARAVLS
ncbi:hypothetical protein PENTCL1PPCAC_26051, partial [Pristionchus entomophagus]